MGIEIERKFLINETIMLEAKENGDPDEWYKEERIQQGYIMDDVENKTLLRVRIAIRDNESEAWITIKKAISDVSRFEYEYEIPVKDATEMLEMCPVIIDKTRQYFAEDDVENFWVIDTFHLPTGENLIVAETELSSEDQEIDLPEWVVEEVTNDSTYYNSNIAKMIQSK
jgi:adenylate cyclase